MGWVLRYSLELAEPEPCAQKRKHEFPAVKVMASKEYTELRKKKKGNRLKVGLAIR